MSDMNYISKEVLSIIIGLAFSIPLSIIGYFLKRTMNRVDEDEKKINTMEKGKADACTVATKVELNAVVENVKEVKSDIEKITSDYLSREDFVRSISEINHKFDRMEDKIDKNAVRVDEKLDKLLNKMQ